MRNTLKEYLDGLAKIRRRQKRTLPVVIGLSALVAFSVSWQMHETGISMSGELLCEQEEHSHTEECYEKVLICDESEAGTASHTEHVHSNEEGCFKEVQTQICAEAEHVHGPDCQTEVTTQICNQEESETHTHNDSCYQTTVEHTHEHAEHTHNDSCFITEQVLDCSKQLSAPAEGSHIHSEECYEEKLICEEEEHVHSDKCHFANQVDVEDPESWMAGMDRYFTGNPRRDLVIAAVHQLGYVESTENIKQLDNGQIHGYTRYGHWFGSPYNSWNATFASFALWQAIPGSLNVDESGMPKEVYDQSEHQMVIPFGLTPVSWQTKLINAGLWNSVTKENRENPATMIGSVIFLNTEDNGLLEGGSIPAGMAKADRVAIVIGVDHETGMLKTIEGELHHEDSEGNTFKYVGVSQIGIHEPAVLGYLMPPELPARDPELVHDFFYTNTFEMETEKEQDEEVEEEEEIVEITTEEFGGISVFSAAQRGHQVVRVTFHALGHNSNEQVKVDLYINNLYHGTKTLNAIHGKYVEWTDLEESLNNKYSVVVTIGNTQLETELKIGGKLTSIEVVDNREIEVDKSYMIVYDPTNKGNVDTVLGYDQNTNRLDHFSNNPFPDDGIGVELDDDKNHTELIWEEGSGKDSGDGKRILYVAIDPKEPKYLCLENGQISFTTDINDAADVSAHSHGKLNLNGKPFNDYYVYQMYETTLNHFYAYPPLDVQKKSEYTGQPLEGAQFELQHYDSKYVHIPDPSDPDNKNKGDWDLVEGWFTISDSILSDENGIVSLPIDPEEHSGRYKLVEISAPEGYKTPIESDFIEFTFDKGILTLSDSKSSTLNVEKDPSNPNKMVIYNNISIVLPETGGPGIAVYLIGGTGLICLSLIGFTRKKLMK